MPVDFTEGYFAITLNPGEAGTYAAEIRNIDIASIDLQVFVTHARSGVNGGFIADNEPDTSVPAASWIQYDEAAFTLSPDSSIKTSFTLTIPNDAAPGQYIAAFVTRTAGTLPLPGSENFNQIVRSVIAIVITVPGTVTPGFSFGTPAFSTEPGSPHVQIPITNTGNIRVKPAGTITITKPDGTAVATSPIQMGAVYASDQTMVDITLPEQLAPGDYVISGTLTDEATKTSVTIEKQTITLANRDAAPPTFSLDPVTITANATPIAFANVDITVNNAGQLIPTANVTLNVKRDGKDVESYPLAQNQALANGSTQITQRYIPLDGWQSGTYSFEVVVSSVNNGTETMLTTVPVTETIIVP